MEAKFRDAYWRYEWAYVQFLHATKASLRKAEKALKEDFEGVLTEENLMNRGLYAKILARQEHLEEAYKLLGSLLRQARAYIGGYYGEDAQRWIVNAAAHRHEFATGLFAHGRLKPKTVQKRFKELIEASERYDPSVLRFNRALDAIVIEEIDHAKAEVKALVEDPGRRKGGEQRATYLALQGAVYEVHLEPKEARQAYLAIRGLPLGLDNRRGARWAGERLKRKRLEADRNLLNRFLRVMFPIRLASIAH